MIICLRNAKKYEKKDVAPDGHGDVKDEKEPRSKKRRNGEETPSQPSRPAKKPKAKCNKKK